MDKDSLAREFQRRTLIYDSLKAEALFILEHSLGTTDIKLHSISSRIKKLDSLIDKARRKQVNRPFEDILDIVGIRVVCLFLSDIERISKVLHDVFTVLREDNKVEGVEVSSFGYMSVHFIVEMKEKYVGPRYDSIAKIPFEIQVRTIAMDAWANVSHYLDYKSDTDVPKELRRDFYALSGLFYVADRHFEMFFEASKEMREKMLSDFGKVKLPRGREINLDSLTAYLANKLPDREHSDSKSVSELIRELVQARIESIDHIDHALEMASDAFRAFENDYPPSGGRFTDVGVIRASLDLVDNNYREIRGLNEGIRYEQLLKYAHLLKK